MTRPTNFRWINASSSESDADSFGGVVQTFKAAGALNIGDVVFLSAALTVNKSTTEADYNKAIGVVVGGKQTQMTVLQDDIDIGEPAASAANELVLVCVLGKCKVVSGAAVTLGDKLTGSTVTAGRVATATITTDAAAGDTGRILGTALETAAGAAEKILALINIH